MLSTTAPIHNGGDRLGSTSQASDATWCRPRGSRPFLSTAETKECHEYTHSGPSCVRTSVYPWLFELSDYPVTRVRSHKSNEQFKSVSARTRARSLGPQSGPVNKCSPVLSLLSLGRALGFGLPTVNYTLSQSHIQWAHSLGRVRLGASMHPTEWSAKRIVFTWFFQDYVCLIFSINMFEQILINLEHFECNIFKTLKF